MKLKVEISRDGFTKMKNYMERMGDEFAPWLQGFLVQQAEKALAETIQGTPPAFKQVKGSWQLGAAKCAGGSVEVSIINEDEKASYAEYGYADQKTGKWVEGHFMCTLSIESMLKEMPAKFEQEFHAWVRGLEE